MRPWTSAKNLWRPGLRGPSWGLQYSHSWGDAGLPFSRTSPGHPCSRPYIRSSGSRYPLFAPHTFQSLPAPIAINVIKRTVNLHLFSGLWIASKMYQTIFLNILLTNNDNLSTNSIIAFYTVCPDPPFSEVKGWKVVTWSTLKYSHFYRRKNSSRRFWKCTAQCTCISGVFVDLGVVHRIAVYPISVD